MYFDNKNIKEISNIIVDECSKFLLGTIRSTMNDSLTAIIQGIFILCYLFNMFNGTY